ncbi:MAG: hypothetical protein ACOC3Z_01590 [Nanoarchaeota archaeon]
MEDYIKDDSMEEFLGGDLGSPTHEAEEKERIEANDLRLDRLYLKHVQERARETLESLRGCNTIDSKIWALKEIGYTGVKIPGGFGNFKNINNNPGFYENISRTYEKLIYSLSQLEKNPSDLSRHKSLVNRIT